MEKNSNSQFHVLFLTHYVIKNKFSLGIFVHFIVSKTFEINTWSTLHVRPTFAVSPLVQGMSQALYMIFFTSRKESVMYHSIELRRWRSQLEHSPRMWKVGC